MLHRRVLLPLSRKSRIKQNLAHLAGSSSPPSSAPTPPLSSPPLPPPFSKMFRRAVSSIHGYVASSQRRGFLTVSVQNGPELAQYKLTVPWKIGAKSPSKDAIDMAPSRGVNANPSRVTLNSVESGCVIASSELIPATKFDSKYRRGRGKQRTMVDLCIWPQEFRAAATIMRTNNSRWTWHSTWNFSLVASSEMSEDIPCSQNEKSLLPLSSSHRRHLQYKGFISKQIAAEFEVSMKANFSIQRTLGEGAEGEVFKCISRKGAHPVAVKRYISRKAVNDEPREPRIMKMLSHANVKKLYIGWNEKKEGSSRKESTVYLAQELCKGTLDDYLEKRTAKGIHEKLKVFKEIVDGLSYLHQQGAIHRDIKPGKIFLDDQNSVKIGDFGSGAFMRSASCLGGGRLWGTAMFESPELWRSKAHNEKVDIFSIGIVYFELFGGFATNNGRFRRLEKLHKVLKSRGWKTKPLRHGLSPMSRQGGQENQNS